MKKLKYLLLLPALIPLLAFPQKSEPGNWLIYIGSKKLRTSWNFHHELQYRNYNFFGDMEQLLLRAGLGYNISGNNNNLLAGYGFIITNKYNEDTDETIRVDEHRIFQQFITKQTFNRISLQHRYRFEQRFIGPEFRSRFRYFLALNIPFNKNEMTARALYFSGYNEIFLEPEGNIFERNRLYSGLGYVISSTFRFEAGLMNQYTLSGGRNQLNLIAFFTF